MKIYLNKNVYDAAIERINFIFDEFENIIVNFSGGKDSTVVFNLVMSVAKERNRLPVSVMFIDQEAEWNSVIEYIRCIMNNEDVKPYWLQVPFKIFNATSFDVPWLECWKPGVEWMRDKEDISIKENKFGTESFKELFTGFLNYYFHNKNAAFISGVRCEESPSRMRTLTQSASYKYITWGNIKDKKQGHYTFYPIYDWSHSDVWKSIHSNSWSYCKIYDYQYQYGINIRDMRVSNLHHETAIKNLYYLQEIESDTWNKLTNRLNGVNTAGQLGHQFTKIDKLPYMFNSWIEYRDYLLDNLITEKESKEKFKIKFSQYRKRYIPEIQEKLTKVEIQMILVNDFHGTKYSSFAAAHFVDTIKFREKRNLPLSGYLGLDFTKDIRDA